MRKLWLVLVPCLALLTAAPAMAQRSTATIRGTITDQSKGVIPGATVTAKNEATGLTRSTVTNDSGRFVLSELPIGTYRVDAELAGFKTASRTAIPLRVADDYVVDFVLDPGEITEVVTVEASSTPVKVLGGDVSGVVTGQQVRELPLNGRNFLQLATLMPGVNAPDNLNVKDKGLLGGSDLSVSGGDTTNNLWTVDGANNNDVGSNRTILIYPSLEAIDEFKILRNSYGPEFGGAGGAQINIVTRGGTNQFRGSGFYSVRNDAFNTTDYFLEQANQPKGELERNDFGGFIGGPLMKDKLFFFGGLEWSFEDRGTTRVAQVPTALERAGDFSGPRACATAPGIPNDPSTGQPFDGNRIPQERLSPAGLLYLSQLPLPNTTPGEGSCNNWIGSITSPLKTNQQHIRGDWNLSNSTRVMVRYTHESWKNDSPSVQSNLWGDDPFPSIDSNWDQPSTSFVTSLNQTFGTSATNSLQFSYSANRIEIRRGGDSDLNSQIVAAMPSIFSVKQHAGDLGYPVWWGGAGYAAMWNEAPFDNNQDLFVIKDDYTRVFGKHFVKAGMLVSWNKKNEDTVGNGSTENWNFWGSSGLNGWGATSGNILADMLLRDMTFGFSEFSEARSANQRWRDLEFYVADSWQVSPKLTIDYGVRYSLYYNPYTTDDKITSFQPSLYDANLGADACNGLLQPPDSNACQEAGARGGAPGPNRSLMDQDLNNFAPRIGMAWDIFGDGKTAVRAGLGQFFQRERLSPLLAIARNPPFLQTITGIRKLDTIEQPSPGAWYSAGLGLPNQGREVDFKAPNSWQWNVSVQKEVWRNTTIDVGYVASYGYDLLHNVEPNQVPSADNNGNGVSDRLDYARSQPADASLRPFGVFGDRDMVFWDHDGESTYHSLQTQFISRFGRGSQFQTSYTLARSRANYNLADSGQGLAQGLTTLDNENPDLDWGRPDVGRTHIFNASLVWLLPSLEDHGGLTKSLFGDWEITTIVGAASGAPFTAYIGTIPGLNGGPSGLGYDNAQRPNRTSESCEPSGGPDEQIVNPGAYTLNGFQLGTIGTAERGDCTGPGYFQTDLGLFKNFQLTDTVRLQFRWDIFNLFNNTNFLGINSGLDVQMDPTSAVFDTGNATTANSITSAVIPSNFGQATRTRDARQMQFGLKIIW